MRRLRYADVTATLALVVALGGTSYAVTALPRNSVGASQIKAHAVTKAKLARGVVLSGPRGRDGSQGPAGAAGAAGAPGLAGVEIIAASESTPGIGYASAVCPAGKIVVGGGGQSVGSFLTSSQPNATGNAWTVRATGAMAYAICSTVAP